MGDRDLLMAEGPPGIHPLSAPPSLLRRLLSRSRRQLVLGALAVVLVAAVVTGVALAATTAAGNGPVYVRGAVAADVGLCSEMGVDVMRQGGNAVDAAITTTLCVGLVNAQSSGIGGGGFMVVYNATTGVGTTIDFRETAPAAATQDMYTSSPACLAGGDADRCPSRFGGLSVAVPAELRGLEKAWQMFGRLPWSQLVTPVADLAESGFEVSAYTAESVAGSLDLIKASPSPALADLLLPGGTPLREGATLKRPLLAATLRRVADEGADVLYAGEVAQGIVDAAGAGGSGILTLQDLESYAPVVRETVNASFGNYTLLSAPAPASGAVISMVLGILDGYTFEGRDALTVHRMIEAFKFAYAKAAMVSPVNASWWRDQVTDNMTHHDPAYYGAHYDVEETPGTTHLSVVGPDGTAVGVTSTVNLHWGSKVMTRHGVLLNNEMDDFASPGISNAFGVEPSESNFIRPGKRPLSSSAPSIVVDRAGVVQAVAGASGGTRITTSTAQVLLNMLMFKQNVRSAVDEPRVHDQLLPDYVLGERDYASGVRAALEAKGHNWRETDHIAVTQAVRRLKNGHLTAASDKRKGGVAAGF